VIGVLIDLGGELQKHGAVFSFFLKPGPCGKGVFYGLALPVCFLRLLGLFPEVGIGAKLLELFQAGLLAGYVKDNLEWFPCVSQATLFCLSTG